MKKNTSVSCAVTPWCHSFSGAGGEVETISQKQKKTNKYVSKKNYYNMTNVCAALEHNGAKIRQKLEIKIHIDDTS